MQVGKNGGAGGCLCRGGGRRQLHEMAIVFYPLRVLHAIHKALGGRWGYGIEGLKAVCSSHLQQRGGFIRPSR